MREFDFDNFKKINQDKKSATLLHPDGHEIKINVAGLSPEMKKQLEELPLNQAEPEGPVQALDPDSPAPVKDAPAAMFEPETQAVGEAVAAPQPEQAPAPMPMASAPAPQMQQASMPMAQAKPVEFNPQEDAAKQTKENLLFGQDLANGHIKPKTYQDLFNEKSTLGKVGTLFGLLVSGAGAGLTHQPNAVIAMMDKQIQNDLEAQKHNQGNKQNWYKLSMEHTRNAAMNALTSSEAFLKANEADRQKMINKTMGVADSEASTQALNSMRLTFIHDQQNAINKLPPGPQREAAQTFLTSIAGANQKQMHDDNLKVAEQKKQVLEAPVHQEAHPKGEAKVAKIDSGPINQTQYQNMLTQGKLMSGSGYVDPRKGIDPNDNAAVEKAITESQVNWKNYRDVMEVANALGKMERAGQLPTEGFKNVVKKLPWVGDAAASGVDMFQGSAERPREVLVNALTQRLASHGASDKTVEEIRNSLTPNMFDSPKTMKMLEETIYQHFAHNDKEQSGIFTKYPAIKKDLPRLPLSIDKGKSEEKESKKDSKGGLLDVLNKITRGS